VAADDLKSASGVELYRFSDASDAECLRIARHRERQNIEKTCVLHIIDRQGLMGHCLLKHGDMIIGSNQHLTTLLSRFSCDRDDGRSLLQETRRITKLSLAIKGTRMPLVSFEDALDVLAPIRSRISDILRELNDGECWCGCMGLFMCDSCDSRVCTDCHGVCDWCGETFCQECAEERMSTCGQCAKGFCDEGCWDDIHFCECCYDFYCKSCRAFEACVNCKEMTCEACMIHCSACGDRLCSYCWDEAGGSDSTLDCPRCDSCWGLHLWRHLEDMENVAAEQDRKHKSRMVATHAASSSEGEEDDDEEDAGEKEAHFLIRKRQRSHLAQ